MADLILDALFVAALRNDRPITEPYGIRLATETAYHRRHVVELPADQSMPALGDLVRSFTARHDAAWAVLGIESWSTPTAPDDSKARRADGSVRDAASVLDLSDRERRRCLILIGERRGGRQVRRLYHLDPDPIRGADLLYTQPVIEPVRVEWPGIGALIVLDPDARRVYRRTPLKATDHASGQRSPS